MEQKPVLVDCVASDQSSSRFRDPPHVNSCPFPLNAALIRAIKSRYICRTLRSEAGEPDNGPEAQMRPESVPSCHHMGLPVIDSQSYDSGRYGRAPVPRISRCPSTFVDCLAVGQYHRPWIERAGKPTSFIV